MTNVKSRRIRLRQHAVLEPYTLAERHVSASAAGSSVVPTASPSQARLEGEIFANLGYIHEPRVFSSGEGPFIIDRIFPSHDSLTVQLHASSSPSKLCYSLLPTWDSGSEVVDNGVIGLRQIVDHESAAVHFHVPNQLGRVTFTGVDTGALVRERDEWLRSRSIHSVDSSMELTPQEVRTTWGDHKAGPVASALVRRLGLLRLLEPKWIDTWSSFHRFSVEVSVPENAFDRLDDVIDRLTSRSLSPRLRRLDEHFESSYYFPLILEGTDLELDLRITTL